MKAKKKLLKLESRIIPTHRDYLLPMGTIFTTGELGLLKEVEFEPITLQSNDTITMTFTPKIVYTEPKEPHEEKNQIKIWLNNLRYKISKLFWNDILARSHAINGVVSGEKCG